MTWLKNLNSGSSDPTYRESILILQFIANLIFSYVAGSLNQVRNIYFAIVLLPIVIPVIFTAMFLYGSSTVIKMIGAVLCLIATILLVFFVLVKAPEWLRFMV